MPTVLDVELLLTHHTGLFGCLMKILQNKDKYVRLHQHCGCIGCVLQLRNNCDLTCAEEWSPTIDHTPESAPL